MVVLLYTILFKKNVYASYDSGVDSGGAGGTRAPPEFGGSEKGRSLISAYRNLAIAASTSGFKKLPTALKHSKYVEQMMPKVP